MSQRVRRLLGLGAAALWLAAPAESAERQPAALGTGRVVVVPVNLAVRVAPELEPGIDPVWHALIAYFTSQEKPAAALARGDAGALWNEVMADEKQAGGGGDLHAAYRRFTLRVAEQARFGSIVFPTLVTHAARVEWRTAQWDGVRRPIEVPGNFRQGLERFGDGKIWVDRHGAQGELAAASLHVAVFAPTGELIHEGTGGLVLLQELALPASKAEFELTTVMRKNPFEASDQLREGIAVAFSK
jgi:hypothetical protein